MYIECLSSFQFTIHKGVFLRYGICDMPKYYFSFFRRICILVHLIGITITINYIEKIANCSIFIILTLCWCSSAIRIYSNPIICLISCSISTSHFNFNIIDRSKTISLIWSKTLYLIIRNLIISI
jgi:hypothetical protein